MQAICDTERSNEGSDECFGCAGLFPEDAHSIAERFFVVIRDTIRVNRELHLTQIHHIVIPLDEHINLSAIGIIIARQSP
jgi:hypothetical protein